MVATSHKVFLSYHKADQDLVDRFIAKFDDTHKTFIMRGIRAPEDIINSTSTDYVMSEIRRRFLKDSTVTMVLLGKCTWARRFVDWEIQSSLRKPLDGLPNGLLGVIVDPNRERATLPDRFKSNKDSGYAAYYGYPAGPVTLGGWIDAAFEARSTKSNLIVNPRERYSYNRTCH